MQWHKARIQVHIHIVDGLYFLIDSGNEVCDFWSLMTIHAHGHKSSAIDWLRYFALYSLIKIAAACKKSSKMYCPFNRNERMISFYKNSFYNLYKIIIFKNL